MNNKIIRYVGFYDLDKYKEENRNYAISAKNKMDYIISSLEKLKRNVEVISPSWSGNSDGIYAERNIVFRKKSRLIIPRTFGAKSKFKRIWRILNSWIWLIGYMIKNVEKKETIIVYHSLMLIVPIVIIKKIKKINLILEVEEIYTDVLEVNRFFKYLEKKFINQADSYILSNDFLEKKIINKDKSKIVLYGIYENSINIDLNGLEEDVERNFNKDKINLVYSGVIDANKGAFKSVQIGEFLSELYHIHIIGFGSEENILKLKKYILEVNKNTKCKITYDGIFIGDDYKSFLRKCDIGLCTQDKNASYSETSFPSKIMSYICNGLKVVSVKLNSIVKSKIVNEINLYEDEDPKKIAELIKKIQLNGKKEKNKFIEELDNEFKYLLNKMIDKTGENYE